MSYVYNIMEAVDTIGLQYKSIKLPYELILNKPPPRYICQVGRYHISDDYNKLFNIFISADDVPNVFQLMLLASSSLQCTSIR